MFYKIIKRMFDAAVSGLALVVLLPLWIVAIIGIEISDPGPVFYMAKRVGKNNKIFRMFKFRSMRVDKSADEKSFKADTKRIFKFGKFISTRNRGCWLIFETVILKWLRTQPLENWTVLLLGRMKFFPWKTE